MEAQSLPVRSVCFAKGTSFPHPPRNNPLFVAILRSWVSKLETKGLPAAASETAFAAEWASMENDIAKADLILQNVDSWNC